MIQDFHYRLSYLNISQKLAIYPVWVCFQPNKNINKVKKSSSLKLGKPNMNTHDFNRLFNNTAA